MISEETKDEVRAIVREMMPDIPLPYQEELVGQVEEFITRHGSLRAATLGQIAVELLGRNATSNDENNPG